MDRRSQNGTFLNRPYDQVARGLAKVAATTLTALMVCLCKDVTAAGSDAEIAGFRLTDVSGSVALRYLLDDRDRESQASSADFQTQKNLEAELYLLTRSYVYHPDFLDMKIGGGPLLVSQDFSSVPGTNSTNEALFNFLADLKFLEQKAYPIRAYYQLSHPSVTTSLTGSFLTERREYGTTAMLRAPVSPVQLTFDAFHFDTIGSGEGATLDENTDEWSLNAYRSYRTADRISLSYRANRQDSRSGSPGLPIQESRITTYATDLDARNVFGANGQLQLVQQINLIDQETELVTTNELQDRRYFGNLNWAHSDVTRTYYQYQYREALRPEQSDARHHGLLVGTSHERGDNLIITAEASAEDDKDISFDRRAAGARAGVSYSRPTSFGSFNFGASIGGKRTDQKADSDVAYVFDEPVVLIGTQPAALNNEFVVETSVIVQNEPKTQIFVEGLDYRLVSVGSTTSIQRLVGGNIIDGQTVLVEYSYLTGGTVTFDTLGQNYNVEFRFLEHYSLYARFHDRNNSLVSGVPTVPLNSSQDLQVGGRVDMPLGDRWTVGGEYYRTDHNEEIASFVRDSFDVYAQVRLPMVSSLRVAMHREIFDNETSNEDVDLTQYRATLRSRPFRGVVIAWNVDYLEDTGGSLFRERFANDFSVGWVYRQMRITARAEIISETLGQTVRDYTRVTAQLQRAFW
jgi:hypothetical protein